MESSSDCGSLSSQAMASWIKPVWKECRLSYRIKNDNNLKELKHTFDIPQLQFLFEVKKELIENAFKEDLEVRVERGGTENTNYIRFDSLSESFTTKKPIKRKIKEVLKRVLLELATLKISLTSVPINGILDKPPTQVLERCAVIFSDGEQIVCVAENNECMDKLLVEIGHRCVEIVDLKYPYVILQDLGVEEELNAPELPFSMHPHCEDEYKCVFKLKSNDKTSIPRNVLDEIVCTPLKFNAEFDDRLIFDQKGSLKENFLIAMRKRLKGSTSNITFGKRYGSAAVYARNIANNETFSEIAKNIENAVKVFRPSHDFLKSYEGGEFCREWDEKGKLFLAKDKGTISCTDDVYRLLYTDAQLLHGSHSKGTLKLDITSPLVVRFLGTFGSDVREEMRQKYNVKLNINGTHVYLEGPSESLQNAKQFCKESILRLRRSLPIPAKLDKADIIKVSDEISQIAEKNKCCWKVQNPQKQGVEDNVNYDRIWVDPLKELNVCIQSISHLEDIETDILIELTQEKLFPLTDIFHSKNMLPELEIVQQMLAAAFDTLPDASYDRETNVVLYCNSDNMSIISDKGQVSKMIAQKAGEKLQKECSQKYPEGIQIGQVAYTGPYELKDPGNVKYLFHSALPFHEKANVIVIVKKFVKRCLYLADRLDCKSVAFPAVGVGQLKYPRRETASAMLEAIEEYKNETAMTNVQEVKIFVYEGDKKACQSFFDEHWKRNLKYFDVGLEDHASSPHNGSVEGPMKCASSKPETWNDQMYICESIELIGTVNSANLAKIFKEERITEAVWFTDASSKMPCSSQVGAMLGMLESLFRQHEDDMSFVSKFKIITHDETALEILQTQESGLEWSYESGQQNLSVELVGKSENYLDLACQQIGRLLTELEKRAELDERKENAEQQKQNVAVEAQDEHLEKTDDTQEIGDMQNVDAEFIIVPSCARIRNEHGLGNVWKKMLGEKYVKICEESIRKNGEITEDTTKSGFGIRLCASEYYRAVFDVFKWPSNKSFNVHIVDSDKEKMLIVTQVFQAALRGRSGSSTGNVSSMTETSL
ncbi:PAR14-like protein [Mya arenaria]|uniref:PAR14-like protein n=1 Tax=Mya arenaria TaxID=6604 RepID=A0ABY7FKA4_MYAAR|nr:PAR14-like protein [Mya arenaria]